jgi:hypothetical protein
VHGLAPVAPYELGSELGDLVVETVDGSAGGAELREQDVDEQEVGLNGSGVGGQRQVLPDGGDAPIDGGLIADVVAAEKVARVPVRARWKSSRVGQRSTKSAKTAASLSRNQSKICGK